MSALSSIASRDAHSQNARRCRGFSLIEITLALGIISFALVAIMGLIPVALQSATDSQRQTRATFIAQSLFADIASGHSPTNTFAVVGADPTQSGSRLSLNLSGPNSTTHILFSDSGIPLGVAAGATFSNAVSNADAAFGATLIITENPVYTNLSRVEVTVEAPLSAPSEKRSTYSFLTSMRDR